MEVAQHCPGRSFVWAAITTCRWGRLMAEPTKLTVDPEDSCGQVELYPALVLVVPILAVGIWRC